MSASAKEIAQRMGVSAAAVSMALNGKRGVSEETRNRIMITAREMGYDFTRLTDKKHANGTIRFILYRRQGAVVGDTPFFSQLSEGIENSCKAAGFKLQISYLYRSDTVKQELQELLLAGCDGMILLGTEMLREDFEPFLYLPVPLVLLDTYFDTMQHDCVLINNVQGAFWATNYLITRTQKQPGYLHSAYAIGNFEERADGFYKAVRYHGMSTSKSPVHRLMPSVEGAFADMMGILEKGEEIAPCYFADNDLIAIGAMKALQAKGWRIPEEVAVIGFDDIPSSAYVEPPLTTVHVPKQYMGEVAVRRLLENMQDSSHLPIKIEVGITLIKRKSV